MSPGAAGRSARATVRHCHRFEDSGVGTGLANIAGSGVAAIGNAGDPAENDSHGTAQNVSGLAWREKQRLLRSEFEPERVEVKFHYRAIIRSCPLREGTEMHGKARPHRRSAPPAARGVPACSGISPEHK